MSDKVEEAVVVVGDHHERGELEILKPAVRDVDIAAAYADRLEGENAYSRKEEMKLRWKLDWRLVPILWMNVTLGAMDKLSTRMRCSSSILAHVPFADHGFAQPPPRFTASRPIPI
jgi:hypothetical protein